MKHPLSLTHGVFGISKLLDPRWRYYFTRAASWVDEAQGDHEPDEEV